MSKLVAIAFSDIHIHKFKAFAPTGVERLHWSLEALKEIFDIAKEKEVPILFCGDLLHDPKEVENYTMSQTQFIMNAYLSNGSLKVYAISGNHDMSEKNSITNSSPTHLDSFTQYEGFIKMDNARMSTNKLNITGIPYYNSEKDLIKRIKEEKEYLKRFPQSKLSKKLKILMLHNDIPGAKTPTGQEIGDCEIPKDLDKFFKTWDIVLCGHIHKPQRISRKVYMLGSPIHQTAGDEANEMGYWEVYSNGKMKFIHMDRYPKFWSIDEDLAEQAKDQLECEGRMDDYIIPIAREEDGRDDVEETSVYAANSRRKDLAKQYCKDKGIKDKNKIRKLIEVLENE